MNLPYIRYQLTGAQPEMFQGRGGFVKLGHFDKYFIKKSRKKGSAGKNFVVFFLLDILKTILNGKFSLRTLFLILKNRAGETSSPPP